MKINGVEVCKPIKDLAAFLKTKNFVVTEHKVSDCHFNEVSIVMKGSLFEGLNSLKIDGIEKTSKINNAFICNCHWSMIKLEFENKL